MKLFHRALILVVALLVTACPRLPNLMNRPESTVTAQQVQPIQGTVDFSAPGRTVQTTIGEIAKGATVGLIDSTTGYTVATTVTDTNGRFKLSFANGWQPTQDAVYYLEAIKGLAAGTSLPNRVGADLARVRTLIRNHDSVWTSTTGLTINLNPTTTAVSIILSLRNMTPSAAGRQITPGSLIGFVDVAAGTDTIPSPLLYGASTPTSGLLPSAMVTSAYLAVLDALAKDSDPFRAILLDTTDPQFNTLLNAPRVVSVAALNPVAQSIGGSLDIIGSGFSATASENVVEFSDVGGGPVPATVTAVSADLARLTVTVPSGAVTGPVAVTVGGRKIIGPTFYLGLQSGHEAIDLTGNLYVANDTFGTIAKVTPQGAITTFVTGLDHPRALTIKNDKIYVTCAGTKKGVLVVDMAFPGNPPLNYTSTSVIADPRGIAFDSSNRLYVSDGTANALYRIDATGSAPVTIAVTGTALSSPHGIGFGSDGRLYVANFNANNVVGVTLDVPSKSGVSAVFQQGLSGPWGVAFDSVGNMYVSNNRGDSIYRWLKDTNSLAPYANMPTPGGLVADRAGYVYAVDNFSNNLYRITSLGDSALFASGLSAPTGIVKVGNVLYVLSRTNNSLMTIDTTTTALSTLARGFNQPVGLTYDNVRDCFYVSNIGNGTIVKVDRTTGNVATVISGMPGFNSGPAGIMYRNGLLYVGVSLASSGGTILRAYDVTNFGAGYTSYASNQYNFKGLSKDLTSGPNGGSFYIATGPNNRILRVVGDNLNTGSSSKTGANYVQVFKDSTGDASLNNPRDVAVDSNGLVWVANQAAPGSVTIYNPDGSSAAFSPLTNGVSNPFGINFDGSRVWVANQGNKTITGYDLNGALFATLSLSDTPRNLGFLGTTMYVVCNEGIGTIPNYASGGTYGRVTTLGANSNDIDLGPDGTIYEMRSQGYKIPPDLSGEIPWITNYDSPNFLWRIPAGNDWYYTDNYRFGLTSQGNYAYRMTGSRRSPHGYEIAGVDSNGNVYIQGGTTCSGDAVTRIQPGTSQKEWWYTLADQDCYEQTQGAYAADSNGNFYIGLYQGAGITKIDPAGTPTTVTGNLSPQPNYTSYGMWVDPTGTTIYQTVTSQHRVDLITVSGGARQPQPFGLSAAEM